MRDGEPSHQPSGDPDRKLSGSTEYSVADIGGIVQENRVKVTPGTQSRALPFLRLRDRSATWKKRRQTENDGAKGPLGLHLLHESSNPLINLVFVHGLRGGSIKTWRKGEESQMFWPQYWLPSEDGFLNVNIHSFGYESDWGSSKPSILNVHDFGRALFEEMRSSSSLRQNPNAPIILVGHSMGGLVIKKAYVLAQQDIVHRQLGERIRCIFFLATPHRGSDYAAVLNTVLAMSGIIGASSSREYITDLTKGNSSAELINEDFGRHAHSLQIYSFYETLPTRLGISSSMIVEKNSAVLGAGFRNEVSRYINASHREICKFDSREDPNYQSIKNSLSSAIQYLIGDDFETSELKVKSQLQALQSFLCLGSLTDECHEKVEGTCSWLDKRYDYLQWRDAIDDSKITQHGLYSPSLFWITADPGSGKTVLTSHVVSQLARLHVQHAFHYFHAGKKASQSLPYFLRSISYQMATTNASIREALLKLSNDGSTFDVDSARAVWSKIYRAGICKVITSSPQYWVMDGIDECVNYAEFFTLLRGSQTPFPLRILITSRRTPDVDKFTRILHDCVVSVIEIPVRETMWDIEIFVRSHVDDLPIHSEDRESLTKLILSKSNTSFLWVKLVFDELGGVYGLESIMELLQGIPEGMLPYYQRILADMIENRREKHIAKSILLWVTCAARPLSVTELCEAVYLDTNVHLTGARTAIEGLCGQLVTVDSQTSLVNMVHLTARDFLFSDDAGEFKISRSESHARIALTCLHLLVSPVMQAPRHRSFLGKKAREQRSSPLLDYSITYFSEHVYSASSGNDKLLEALNKFLNTTILSWIERVVSQGYLHHLIRVARNFKAYLDRRAKYFSPVNQHVSKIDNWSTDLSRLVTKFGDALISQPNAIYFLVPPLCPLESAIFRQFGRTSDGLILAGSRNLTWDDCVATVTFDDDSAATISCGNSNIAIGLESGSIILYSHSSFQKERIISNHDVIDVLLLDPLASYIACASIKHMTVWDLQGTMLWRKRIRSRCISLTSLSHTIMAVTTSGHAYIWDSVTGDLLEDNQYPFQPLDSTSQVQSDLIKAPFKAAISPEVDLLALSYRNGPTCIYELQSHTWIAWASDGDGEFSKQIVVDLIFNPNPEVNLLLIGYDDSRLSLYDSWSGIMVLSQQPEGHGILTSLSCSSDGRTFGTVDVLGNLQIWDFESLTVLYHILTPSHAFRNLNFTSDGFNLIDMIDKEMKIWSPSALLRKTFDEEGSVSEQATTLPASKGQVISFTTSKIRSIATYPKLQAVLVGNYYGDVLVYTTARAGTLEPSILYSHSSPVIRCLAIGKNNKVASADIGGKVQVWQFNLSQSTKIIANHMIFEARFASSILEILFDQSGVYLLVSTKDSDHVYNCETGLLVGFVNTPKNARQPRKWATLPRCGLVPNEEHFTLCHGHSLVSYFAETFPQKVPGSEVTLDFEPEEGFAEEGISSIIVHPESMSLIMEVSQQQGHVLNSCLVIFRLPDAVKNSETGCTSLKSTRTIGSNVFMHLLGISRSTKRLVFIHKNSWVYSIDLSSVDDKMCVRHCLVPREFLTSNNSIPPMKTVDDDIIFCIHDKLAIIKNGLIFREERTMAYEMSIEEKYTSREL